MLGVVLLVGEMLGLVVLLGIGLVLGGIIVLVFRGSRMVLFGLCYVLGIGCFIVVYSVVDGLGVWFFGSFMVYIVWMCVGWGLLMFVVFVVWCGFCVLW